MILDRFGKPVVSLISLKDLRMLPIPLNTHNPLFIVELYSEEISHAIYGSVLLSEFLLS